MPDHQLNHARRRGGFTVIELLVAVGILAILGAIAAAVYSGAMRSADKTRLSFQLQTIQQGLEAYKTEFNAYPITQFNDAFRAGASGSGSVADDKINADYIRGARTLCKALMGQTPQGVNFDATGGFRTDFADQDGAEGFGFRTMPRSGAFKKSGQKINGNVDELAGKVYGPFLNPDKFRVANLTVVDDTGVVTIDLSSKDYNDTAVLLDANDNPILYYPVLNPQANIVLPISAVQPEGTYIGLGPRKVRDQAALPMYRWNDNGADDPNTDGKKRLLTKEAFCQMLGDMDLDGYIGPGETAAVKNQYILVSAGPDGFYGVNKNDGRNASKSPKEQRAKLDDVTNFAGN